MRVVVEADGGARGNPGKAGYGAVVRDASTGTVLAERWEALGIATNNVAEYSGLIAGLEAAAELGATHVDVKMDSKLVIEQMSGRWQIKHPGLRPLAAKAAALMRGFDSVGYQWIPREQNKTADALANKAMDAAGDTTPPAAAGPAMRSQTQAGRHLEERSTGPATTALSGQQQGEAVRSHVTAEPQPVPATSWEPRTVAATRLVLVRHGETALTAQKRYSGRGDVPLSDTGRAQAQAVASRAAAMGVDMAVTSPLARCVDTAELIGVPVTVEPDLIECDFGEWEGMTFAQVRSRYPSELTSWLGSTSVPPPGGESFQQVSQRVRAAVSRVRREHEGQTVALVSHVSPIKLILRDALAAGDALLHRLYLDPAGLSVVDIYPDGGVAVRTVNDISHLAPRADQGGQAD